MKLLILGGYGVFGGRLAKLLSDITELEMIIAGRNIAHAEEFCLSFQGAALVQPLRLDRKDIADALRLHQPDLVVDASGPFQDYGEDRYRVVSACIAAGVDYLDFADAADFVFGISKFDAPAKDAGVVVLSGGQQLSRSDRRRVARYGNADGHCIGRRRYCPFALRGHWHERHACGSGLCWRAGEVGSERRAVDCAGTCGKQMLYRRRTRTASPEKPSIFACRCTGPAGHTARASDASGHLVGSRTCPRDITPRLEPTSPAASQKAVTQPFALVTPVLRRFERNEVRRASRWHVCARQGADGRHPTH